VLKEESWWRTMGGGGEEGTLDQEQNRERNFSTLSLTWNRIAKREITSAFRWRASGERVVARRSST
jgi:hypothetical protein